MKRGVTFAVHLWGAASNDPVKSAADLDRDRDRE
jgi:hypothetical protein